MTYNVILAIVTQAFNPSAELVLQINMPTKEAKAEIKTHSMAAEVFFNKWLLNVIQSRIYLFYALYLLNRFGLFLQWDQLLLHLYLLI